MARGNFMQNSFLAGEWSPFAQGRTDEQDYYRALNLSLNFISTDNGAAARRSGTRFSAHAKDDSGLVNLIPFISDSSSALVVELTDLLARFHRAGTLLVDANAPEVLTISAATPAVVTTDVAHGWSTGDTVVFRLADVEVGPGLFNRQFLITVLSTTTFSLAHTGPLGTGSVDGTDLVDLVEGGLLVARVTERALPFTGAQVADVKHTEEENTLYLFHPAHEPNTLDRSSLTVTEADFLDGPYLDQNATATTLAFSGTSGSVTVTASAPTGINSGTGFQTTDVGRLIRVNSGSEVAPSWSWLEITARASTTSVTGTIRGQNLASGSATTLWRLGAFSDTTSWPKHGVIHEGRLWLVGPSGRAYGSKALSGDYFDFESTAVDGTVADDNGVTLVFAGSGRQNPQWLLSTDLGLLIGTDGGEYLIRASSFDDPITPFTAQVRKQTKYGASAALPVEAGKNSIFVQSVGRAIMEFRSEGQRFDGNDIARDARHLTSRGVTELAFSSAPMPIIWALRGDNRLIATTYRDDLKGAQVAWHRHSLNWADDVEAGEDATDRYLRGGQSKSTGLVYSIATAPFSDPAGSRYDVLWVAVKRVDTVCIEYLTQIFDETFYANEAFLVDSGNVYLHEDFGVTWAKVSDNPATYDFYGLDRLNGKSVDVTFRGADLGSVTVASGTATAVIPVELEAVEAASQYTAVSEASAATLTENTGYISSPDYDDEVRSLGFNPQQAFAVGLDGVRYFLANADSGGDTSLGIILINAATGLVAIERVTATIASDLSADSVEPPAGWVGSSPSFHRAYVIPETPYVLAEIHDDFGSSVNHGWAYYRIESNSTLTYLGGVAEAPTGISYQAVTDGTIGSGVRMKAFGRNKVADHAAATILLAGYAEAKSLVIPLPSVNYVAANSPVVLQTADNIEGRSIVLGTVFSGWAGIMGTTDTAETPVTGSQGFFLPGRQNKMYLFCYVSKKLMEEHAAASASVAVSALTTLSGVSTDPVLVRFSIVGNSFDTMRAISVDATAGSMFEGFPFDDIGETYAGAAGTSLNDYGNASVFPTDESDLNKPWVVLFPRIYSDGSDATDKLGVRVFLWDPRTETATFQGFEKGQLYDTGVDDVPSANNLRQCLSLFWDRNTSDLLVLSYGGDSSAETVVSKFGELEITFSPVNLVDDGVVDAVIGCNYYSRLQLLRPDVGAGAQNGPALAKTRRIDQYGMLAYRTGGFFIGADNFDLLYADVSASVDSFGRRPLFSGVKHNSLQCNYSFDSMMIVQYQRPVPGTITAISGFSNASDR